MKIIACIKRVPTTDFQPRVGSDGKSLDTSGVQYMILAPRYVDWGTH